MSTHVDARCLDRCALEARAMIGAALAHAWRDPLRHGSDPAPIALDDLAPLPDAWAVVAADWGNNPLDELSLGELTPEHSSIESLVDWLVTTPAQRSRTFDLVFGLVTSKDCPPYETDYCHWEDPTYRSSQMADVGGFYRAFGVEPGGERPERPDHIALELEFIAFLYRKAAIATQAGHEEHIAVCREAHQTFVRDHAAWWMPTFARGVQRRIEHNQESVESPEQSNQLKTLDGICVLLRTWVAIVRLDAGVPASREIIAPKTPEYRPEEEDEACSMCDLSTACAPGHTNAFVREK